MIGGFRSHNQNRHRLQVRKLTRWLLLHPTREYQKEMADRLDLPFPVLSDSDLIFTNALRLPTFVAEKEVLLKRLTMVIRQGTIDHIFYPVFPPDRHAEEVLGWLMARGAPLTPRHQ